MREDGADERRPQSPAAAGMRRVSTATRASSPIRPGSTAFAKRPTQNAENTSRKLGCGGGSACVDHRPPGERARDDREQVERDRDDDPLHSTRRERVADVRSSPGPRHQSSATDAGERARARARRARPGGSQISARSDRLTPATSLVDARRAAARSGPRRSAPARRAARAAPSARAAARPRAARRAPRRARRVAGRNEEAGLGAS